MTNSSIIKIFYVIVTRYCNQRVDELYAKEKKRISDILSLLCIFTYASIKKQTTYYLIK